MLNISTLVQYAPNLVMSDDKMEDRREDRTCILEGSRPTDLYEPRHEKTCCLHMTEHRRNSAARWSAPLFPLHIQHNP